MMIWREKNGHVLKNGLLSTRVGRWLLSLTAALQASSWGKDAMSHLKQLRGDGALASLDNRWWIVATAAAVAEASTGARRPAAKEASLNADGARPCTVMRAYRVHRIISLFRRLPFPQRVYCCT
jgi:hypothetical protein